MAFESSQNKFSISLFLKLYTVTIVAIFCIGLVLDMILASLQNPAKINQPQEKLIHHLAQQIASLPNSTIQKSFAEDPYIQVLTSDKTNINGQLLNNLNHSGGVQLEDDSGQQFLLVVGGEKSENLLKITWPSAPENQTDRVITLIYYALISLVLTLLFLPLSRDLSLLKKSVNSIGQHRRHQYLPAEGFTWLKEFTDIYNSMVERVQSLIENQKELTYSISHELRTPLSRLKFSLALIDNNQPSFTESQVSMQQDIIDLESLITELLDYAKFDHDDLPIHMTRVSVAVWLEDVVVCMAADLKKIRCSFHCANDCQRLLAIIDPTLTQRAIKNIIYNADKYAVSQVRVTLEQSDEQWCIHFDDDGPGIPPSQRSIVFDAFKQLKKSTGRAKVGWGIGLATSKRIMQRQKGAIAIADSDLGGARFSLMFNHKVQTLPETDVLETVELES